MIENYGIVITGEITINKKAINLKEINGDKDYDGLPYFNEGNLSVIYDAFNNLPSNEEVEIIVNENANPVNASEIPYNVTDIIAISVYKTVDGNKEDVTYNYEFTLKGTVTINE